jgi:hypothetical protein
VAASSAAREGRRPGSIILRGSQELAPQDDGTAHSFIIVIAALDPAIHRTKTAGESPPFWFAEARSYLSH